MPQYVERPAPERGPSGASLAGDVSEHTASARDRQARDRDKQGVQRPGKQGVALRVELLPELRQALADAEADARRQGLMPEGAT